MARHQYLPEVFDIRTWDDLKPFFEELKSRELPDAGSFRKWLNDISELESAISENLAWRYIRMTCNTADKSLEESYLDFVSNIQPHIAPEEDALNRRLAGSPWLQAYENDDAFRIYFRGVKGAVEIFREENIPLFTELQTLAQKYASINGAMTVEIDGKEMTLQQASNYLQQTDRSTRENAWRKITARRLQDREELDQLFSDLIQRRHQVALNAGFANFRDYMFKSMGRYDYTKEDCFKFHDAIREKVVPLLKEQTRKRKELLKLDTLKPWDMAVDPHGNQPLKPFEGGEELLHKTIACFRGLDPYFADCLQTMKEKGFLDLESRIGKAPGGYNYPLAESNVPFIFMNAAGNLRDVETMVHEGGHAIHSFLTADLELYAFKNTPSEVAELASMSMELLSMEKWDEFLQNPDDLKRAKREQLEGIIQTLPWIATIDKFQHWIYENPAHSLEERKTQWLQLNEEFGTGMVDYSDLPDALAYSWQRQLHLYEVPFYYIEYGFAQLGAIGVWKQFCANHSKGLEGYRNALKLGYTKGIPDIYQTAGTRFEFSPEYVGGLFGFVAEELEKYEP